MCLYTSCIHSIVDAQDLAGPYEVFDVVAVDAVDVVAGVGVNEGVGRHSQAGEGVGPLGRGGGGFALGYVGGQLDELGGQDSHPVGPVLAGQAGERDLAGVGYVEHARAAGREVEDLGQELDFGH